jgi:hypothetical protein
MNDFLNLPVLFIFGGLIAASIIAMSLFFIVKSFRRAKEIGMAKEKLVKAVKTGAIFSIVPSIPIVIGVGVMMSYLGLAIPWIRLTVIGALQYEIIAMDQAGVTAAPALTPTLVGTALLIMTVSIISGPLLNALFYKKYQLKLADLQQKNQRLLDTVTGALLGGILAGLISYMVAGGIFASSGEYAAGSRIEVKGIVTLLTLFSSAAIMALCGVILKVTKWKWIESYALPFTILGSLGLAFLFIRIF